MRSWCVVAAIVLATLVPAGPAAARTRFRDVAPALGLPAHVHSWAVSTASADGDDVPDLVLSTHAAAVVYVTRDGRLRRVMYEAGDDPHGCAMADVDGNGLGDVYCSRGADLGTIRKRNHLWLQLRPGAFVERARAWRVTDPFGRGRDVAFLDIDGDTRPDLFVGNGPPRPDGIATPNRTYLNVGGERFRQVRIGATAPVGASCAHPADLDGDGWTDLLVCGERRLFLYRNRPGPDGGRRLVDVAPRLGVDEPGIADAWMGPLDGDRLTDLVTAGPSGFRIYPGRSGGTFGRPVVDVEVPGAVGLAVGELDGREGADVVLVRGCAGGRNLRDRSYLSRGGWRFVMVRLPAARSGCGDVAATIDIDGDGVEEAVVLNGASGGPRGPIQVFTTGSSWRGRRQLPSPAP